MYFDQRLKLVMFVQSGHLHNIKEYSILTIYQFIKTLGIHFFVKISKFGFPYYYGLECNVSLKIRTFTKLGITNIALIFNFYRLLLFQWKNMKKRSKLHCEHDLFNMKKRPNSRLKSTYCWVRCLAISKIIKGKDFNLPHILL